MKTYRVTNFVDKSFLIISITLISFLWLRYFILDNTNCLITSIIVGVVLGKIIINIANKRKHKKLISKQTQNEISTHTLNLSLMTKEECIDFFKTILEKTQPICVKDNMIYLVQNSKTTIFVPCFDTPILTQQSIINILRKVKDKYISKLIILCQDIDQNSLMFAKSITNYEITIYDKAAVYFELLKKYQTYPKNYLTIQTKKKYTFKILLSVAFNRKKAKNYLFCGLIFFVCSWFVMYNWYYIVMASTTLIFAIFSYFNKPFNAPKPSDW